MKFLILFFFIGETSILIFFSAGNREKFLFGKFIFHLLKTLK